METQCENEKQWNILFTVLYPGLLVAALYFFYYFYHAVPERISLFDFALLSLATFRLIRLLVYDRITQFFRDLFREKINSEECPGSGFKASVGHLFGCPWCMGVWVALCVVFLYYLTPFAWFPILVLAISGIASFAQVLANMIGWRAENFKITNQGKGNKK